MEYDLIQLAKECPGLTVSIKLTDLVEANKELIEETKRNLQQTMNLLPDMVPAQLLSTYDNSRYIIN